MLLKRQSMAWQLLWLTGDPEGDPRDPIAIERAMLKLSPEQWDKIFPATFDREEGDQLVTDNEWFNQMEAGFGDNAQ